MASGIEWCDEVWNVAVGCSPVSEGCRNCWAARLSARFQRNPAYAGTVRDGHAPARFNGRINVLAGQADKPARTDKPVRFFVGSLTDLFHRAFPAAARRATFATMRANPRHQYLLLTKRPQAAARWLEAEYGHDADHPLPPFIWVGVSAEDLDTLAARAEHAATIPAAVRWLSLEPMLAPVHALLPDLLRRRVFHWVVIGGESGGAARPMDPDWAAAAVAACAAAGVPVFFKQWGEWFPGYAAGRRHAVTLPTGQIFMPGDEDENASDIAAAVVGGRGNVLARMGKHHAGADVIGGRRWQQYPQPHPDPARAAADAAGGAE